MRNEWYCDESQRFQEQASWMSALPDDSDLAKVSLPGTHDTCAQRGGGAFQCQGLDLASQLAAGIRFLDVRCLHYMTGFKIHHEWVYQGYWFDRQYQFEDQADPCVLDTCIEFLEKNQGECIVMSIKPEYREPGPEDTAANMGESFSDCVCKSISHTEKYWYDNACSRPLLRDVRGTIVLVRRFPENQDPKWTQSVRIRAKGFDFAQLRVQDDYEVWDNAKQRKWIRIAHTFDCARTGAGWWLNFTSGAKAVSPSLLAQYIKPLMGKYLTKCREAVGPADLSMTAIDFPGERLIQCIIESNTLPIPAERRTLWLDEEFGGISHPPLENNQSRLAAGRSLGGIEIKYQGGYGIVNLRCFDTQGQLLMPTRPHSSEPHGEGWFTNDFDGDPPILAQGPIDGIQFAKHGRYGLVNLRLHLRSSAKETWEPWLTSAETEADAECVSEPRVVDVRERINWIETWRESGRGLVDARFGYLRRVGPSAAAQYWQTDGDG